MIKKRLIKRLKWYYPTELFNAFFFSGVIIYLVYRFPIDDILFLLYGIFLMVIILFQGQYYWKIKLYSLSGKPYNRQKALVFFRRSKKQNIVLISIMPFIFILQLWVNDWKLTGNNLTGYALAANLFGILEHINYYKRQLMVDNINDIKYLIRNKKLKRASLLKDLQENKI